jgi:hypothetical protein
VGYGPGAGDVTLDEGEVGQSIETADVGWGGDAVELVEAYDVVLGVLNRQVPCNPAAAVEVTVLVV